MDKEGFYIPKALGGKGIPHNYVYIKNNVPMIRSICPSSGKIEEWVLSPGFLKNYERVDNDIIKKLISNLKESAKCSLNSAKFLEEQLT